MLICTVCPFYMLSRSKKVVSWLDSEPFSLMCYHEFHDIGKSRFLHRIVLILLPNFNQSLIIVFLFVCDFYIIQPLEKD